MIKSDVSPRIFPRLNFFEHAFNDYFDQIDITLDLVVRRPENFTVGSDMLNVDIVRQH